MNIASFYVYRPEHPRAVDYIPLLHALQRSCDRFGLRHVVLTDAPLEGFDCFVREVPQSLMRAVVELQAAWVAEGDWRGADTLFVGADCLIVKDPRKAFAGPFDMAVTYRPGHKLYPINTGTVLVRHDARWIGKYLFAGIAKFCGERWGDDQRAIEQALAPMPQAFGIHERAGMRVNFLPMAGYNECPRSLNQVVSGAVAHFRGKDKKSLIVPWSKRWLR